jgi:hypothetical protein
LTKFFFEEFEKLHMATYQCEICFEKCVGKTREEKIDILQKKHPKDKFCCATCVDVTQKFPYERKMAYYHEKHQKDDEDRDGLRKTFGNISYLFESPYLKPPFLTSKIERNDLPVGTLLDTPSVAPANLTSLAVINGMKKKAATGGIVDEMVLEECVKELSAEYFKLIGPCRMRNIDDAINGVFSDGFDVPIDMTTSAGFPYTQQFKKKDDLIKEVGNYCMNCDKRSKQCECGKFVPDRPFLQATPEFAETVQKSINNWRNGKLNHFTYDEHLKDEKRPVEKVMLAKTRLFSGAPVHFVVADRMIMGDFVHKYKQQKIKLSHAYGIVPQSSEWSDLALKHVKYAKHICVDYEGYDGTLQSSFVKAGYEIIANHFPNEVAQLIKMSAIETSESRCHVYGHIFEKDRGNPSGCYLTTVINCIVNDLVVLYSFKKIAEGLIETDLTTFRNNTAFTAYGDDYILSVNDDWTNFFNPITIGKVVNSLGMKMTVASNKNSNDVQFLPFDKVTFLSRSFLPMVEVNETVINSFFLGPLDKTTILNTFYFKHKQSTDFEVKQTWEGMLNEACLHGELFLQVLFWTLNSEPYGQRILKDFLPTTIWAKFWDRYS